MCGFILNLATEIYKHLYVFLQTSPAAQPSGVPLSDIDVSLKTSELINNGTSYRTNLIDVTFSTAVCSHGYELMQVDLTALQGLPVSVAVDQVQTASEAVSGGLELKVIRGENTSHINILHSTTTGEVRLCLFLLLPYLLHFYRSLFSFL